MVDNTQEKYLWLSHGRYKVTDARRKPRVKRERA